jgi:hypothetical protein
VACETRQVRIRGLKTAPLLAAVIFAVIASPEPRNPIPADAGVYLGWVGTHPGNRLKEGARLAKQFGFQTVRLPLVASVETDFGIGSTCYGRLTLDALVSLPAYADVLRDPAFHTILLTVWGDSHSYDACQPRDPRTDQHPHKRYVDLEYYSSEETRKRMREDYADLTYRIYKDYRGTGKLIGISNWEGDNELYCDAATLYAINPAFRSTCDGTRKTSDALAAYRQFLTLRHEGIRLGQDRARRDGFTGVSVQEVIELSSFHLLKDRHIESMLYDILPSVPEPHYVSYSAWESTGDPAVLQRDLRDLQTHFKAPLIVGEFGFDRGLDRSADDHASAALAVIRKAGMRFAVWWQIFDQPPLEGLGDKGQYGLYDDTSYLTTIGSRFLNQFSTAP